MLILIVIKNLSFVLIDFVNFSIHQYIVGTAGAEYDICIEDCGNEKNTKFPHDKDKNQDKNPQNKTPGYLQCIFNEGKWRDGDEWEFNFIECSKDVEGGGKKSNRTRRRKRSPKQGPRRKRKRKSKKRKPIRKKSPRRKAKKSKEKQKKEKQKRKTIKNYHQYQIHYHLYLLLPMHILQLFFRKN